MVKLGLAASALIVGFGVLIVSDPFEVLGQGAGERELVAAQQEGLLPDDGSVYLPMSVPTAYSVIPHDFTPYRFGRSVLPRGDSDFLHHLFAWTDIAVVERVATQRRYMNGDFSTEGRTNYGQIFAGLALLQTPGHLSDTVELISEAVEEQEDYFAKWRASADPGFFSPRAHLIQSSHRKLIRAYNQLMALYPDEVEHNKQAFFDHLCALDFI